MSRIPSPELVRFLLKHRPLANVPLGQVQGAISTWADEWRGFDKPSIFADLVLAVQHFGNDQLVKEMVQPVVFCLFGDGGDGKSTAANMVERLGVPVFSTDHFITGLQGEWHDNDALRQLASHLAPLQIDNFVRQLERMHQLQREFVGLFFDKSHGFNVREPLSVIEGFVHARDVQPHHHCLREAILRGLLERGYRVWTMGRVR